MENTNTSKVLKTNEFTIVGTLKNVDKRVGQSKKGDEYISVTATVESVIDEVVNEYEINFYTNKYTKEGKESQLYNTYLDMDALCNKKVLITGSLRENRYWNKATSQMSSAQQLTGRWINSTPDSTNDEGSFIIAGFVVKTLLERKNKRDEIYRYDLTLGQADYSDTKMNSFTLHVNPEDKAIVNGVERYQVGDTVQVKGNLNFITVETESEDTHGGFGQKIVRKYTNRQRNFYIIGGSDPIDSDEAYSNEFINELVSAYKANDVKIEANAKDSVKGNTGTTIPASNITKRQTSLI